MHRSTEQNREPINKPILIFLADFKVQKQFSGGRNVFLKNVAGGIGYPQAKR